MTSKTGYEIRLNNDQSIDEIVASNVKHFHLEQMNKGFWSLRLDLRNGRSVSMDFFTRYDATIWCTADTGDL